MTDESMHLLRHAIVARACLDYDTAIRYMARPPEKQTERGIIKHEAMIAECGRFFLGNWFRCLCELDGETVMQAVKENGYCNNSFAASSQHVNRTVQKSKRREQRRKEMEEYEKKQTRD